ncbi:hypothetical protein [Flavobacterium dankookense]|uniref:Uncharacterized protein n=1 Tax=Flavobacterium dankookense TaxID=706186 RepID=A0A4V3CS03_9FLAO|nr:hypothetical protein [Flavobacterium dankookense]TDP58762.1 hypothetical protein BC748_1998 [Flavobacterium dankookense]
MRIKLFFILLYSSFLFGQKPVEIRIDSLTSYDETQEERTFTIKYSITNKTDKTINFILNPEDLIPISGGSMRPKPYYKIYENETSIDMNSLFTRRKETRTFKNEEDFKKYQDSLSEVVKNKTLEELVKENKANTIKNILEMKPNETREYSTTFRWDKNRYFKNDVMEYYIDEKEPHFFELHINLMKEELLSKFSEKEKNEILKDKNFIKGWFTSNKVEINFRE